MDHAELSDIIEIEQLLARYAVGMTKDDIDAVMDVFTPDGTYSRLRRHLRPGRLPDAGRGRAQGTVPGRARRARARRRHRHRPAAALLRRADDPRHAHRLLHRHLPPHRGRLAAAHPVDDLPAQERRPRLRAGARPDPAAAHRPDRTGDRPHASSTSSGSRSTPGSTSTTTSSRRDHPGTRHARRADGAAVQGQAARPSTPAGCGGAGPSGSAAWAARRCCGPTSARRSPLATWWSRASTR